MTAPIELWYWPTPNGWKVSIALEEMGLAYEMKPVNIGTGEQFTPAFQAGAVVKVIAFGTSAKAGMNSPAMVVATRRMSASVRFG